MDEEEHDRWKCNGILNKKVIGIMFPLKWCVNQRGFLTLKCGSSTFCSLLLLLLLFPFAIR